MVAHDGFTLNDLYALQQQEQQPALALRPVGRRRGQQQQLGPGRRRGATSARPRATAWRFMMLSAGVPMITGGDEFLRTQYGNNNPYNLDSDGELAELDAARRDQTNFQTFTQRPDRVPQGAPGAAPGELLQRVGQQRQRDGAAALVQARRRAWPTRAYFNNTGNHASPGASTAASSATRASAIYVAYNGWSGPGELHPAVAGHRQEWYRVTDTSTWNEGANTVRRARLRSRDRRRVHGLRPAGAVGAVADREVAAAVGRGRASTPAAPRCQ